jgi:uncharacterized membrane protein
MTRVAMFAALVFVSAYFSVHLYNVNLGFFIVFLAGLLWGIGPGVTVGLIGFFLWSNFNPFGPAPLPLLIAQLIGIIATPVIGHLTGKFLNRSKNRLNKILILSCAGILSGLCYHIPVDIVDAWLYRPFWERLVGGLLFSLITIVANAIIFPILLPALKMMTGKEKATAA